MSYVSNSPYLFSTPNSIFSIFDAIETPHFFEFEPLPDAPSLQSTHEFDMYPETLAQRGHFFNYLNAALTPNQMRTVVRIEMQTPLILAQPAGSGKKRSALYGYFRRLLEGAFFCNALNRTNKPLAAPPLLIVCPMSNLESWTQEIQYLNNALVKYGQEHLSIKSHSFIEKKHPNYVLSEDYHLYFIGYRALSKEWKCLLSNEQKWGGIIFDEIHHLNDFDNLSSIAIKEFIKKSCASTVLGLSKTPVRTHLIELFQLLQKLHPEQFTIENTSSILNRIALPIEYFLKETEKRPIETSKIAYLEQLLQNVFRRLDIPNSIDNINSIADSFLLLRSITERYLEAQPCDTIEDDSKKFPQKEWIEWEMTPLQQALYLSALTTETSDLLKKLKQIINSPRLIATYPQEYHQIFMPIIEQRYGKSHFTEQEALSSGKMEALLLQLATLQTYPQRVLIVVSDDKMSLLLDHFLQRELNIAPITLKGKVNTAFSSKNTQKTNHLLQNSQIALLNKNSGYEDFNLSHFDTLILFDADWTPKEERKLLDCLGKSGRQLASFLSFKCRNMPSQFNIESFYFTLYERKKALNALFNTICPNITCILPDIQHVVSPTEKIAHSYNHMKFSNPERQLQTIWKQSAELFLTQLQQYEVEIIPIASNTNALKAADRLWWGDYLTEDAPLDDPEQITQEEGIQSLLSLIEPSLGLEPSGYALIKL